MVKSHMNKPVITKIEFTKEELEEIDKLIKGIAIPKKKLVTNKAGQTYEFRSNRIFSRMVAKKRLNELYGGPCCVCGGWPDYKVLYDVDNAKRVERYCQNDLDKWMARID